MNKNVESSKNETRRSFLRKTAGIAAGASAASFLRTPVYGQNQAPSPGSVLGANNRIAVAYIGTGNAPAD